MRNPALTFLLSLCCCWLTAQCPSGDITFSTQGQVDSFPFNYPNCTEIDSNVNIFGNDIIRLDSLYSLKKIGGHLQIEQTALIDLNGLNSLDSVKSFLRILENPSLANLSGFENLHYVGSGIVPTGLLFHWEIGIEIKGNLLLNSLNGIEKLKIIPCLTIFDNPSLASLSGLDSLSYIGRCGFFTANEITLYSLRLINNNSLFTLNGLNSLDTVESDISIEQNYGLTSLAGLENLDYVGEWYISGNYDLSVCNILPLCDYLENGGSASISDNAPGCNSVEEVETACMVSIEEKSDGKPVVIFSPNPVTDFLQIQINDSEKWDITLHDLQGRLMFSQEVSGSQMAGVEYWPAGVYVLQALSEKRVFSTKIVKQ